MWQPGWERGLGENGHMYTNGWVPLLFTWNYPNTVDRLTLYEIESCLKKKKAPKLLNSWSTFQKVSLQIETRTCLPQIPAWKTANSTLVSVSELVSLNQRFSLATHGCHTQVLVKTPGARPHRWPWTPASKVPPPDSSAGVRLSAYLVLFLGPVSLCTTSLSCK